MQGLYKGLGLQSNLEEKILTNNTDMESLQCQKNWLSCF